MLASACAVFTADVLRFLQDGRAVGVVFGQGDVLHEHTHQPTAEGAHTFPLFICMHQPARAGVGGDGRSRIGECLLCPDLLYPTARPQAAPRLGHVQDIGRGKAAMPPGRHHVGDVTCIGPTAQGGGVDAQPFGRVFEGEPFIECERHTGLRIADWRLRIGL